MTEDEDPYVYHMHTYSGVRLLAVADRELVGREFREGDLVLSVPESFYGSEEMTPAEFRLLAQNCDMLNLVGNRCVSQALEMGLVEKGYVLMVEGVKHAQVLYC